MAQFPMFALLLISSAILFQISLANDSANTESRRTRQYPSWPIPLNRPFYMNPWSRSFYPYYSSYYSDAPAMAWNEKSESSKLIQYFTGRKPMKQYIETPMPQKSIKHLLCRTP